jgi:5,10-methenyltetrahydrofolate synthetase
MTVYSRDKPPTEASEPREEPHEYASPPCFLHELDPGYGGDLLPAEQTPPPCGAQEIRRWRDGQRRRLRAQREQMAPDVTAEVSARIVGELRASHLTEGHVSIGIYWPLPGEIDLRPLAQQWVEQGIEVALPAIEEPGGYLTFRAWRPDSPMTEKGLWSIPQPCSRRLVEPTLLLVPMLGFDRDLHRLGNGGGYYDRTLAALSPCPCTVGVCLEAGYLATIFPQPHDVPMDAVVTEREEKGWP